MTNNYYEPEDKDFTDEYIAWLRKTSPAKNIPDERFKKLFDNEEKATYEPDNGPLTENQINWIRNQTFPFNEKDFEIDHMLDELEKRLLNKG